MKSDIKEVLDAVSSKGRFTGKNELAYQAGVLAAWVSRLAKENYGVRYELMERLRKK